MKNMAQSKAVKFKTKCQSFMMRNFISHRVQFEGDF